MVFPLGRRGRSPTEGVERLANGLVRLDIRDDGVGGADPSRGSGLIGLKDRAVHAPEAGGML
jgi:signal transduction histidine kinase